MEKKKTTGIPIANLSGIILNQVPALIVAMDKDYNMIHVNKAGCDWFGKEKAVLETMKCYDLFQTPLCRTKDCPIHRAMETDKYVSGRTEKKRGDETVYFEFTASPLKDDKGAIAGGVEFLSDITQKVIAEQRARQLQEDLMEISTPVLSLWEKVLAVPLIGTLDSRRTQDVMEKALTSLSEEKAEVLIVDITGVPLVDTMVADHLIRMAEAIHLMGGTCILTGISPVTAKTIVHLGIDLSGLNTRSTLSQGLDLAMELVNQGREDL